MTDQSTPFLSVPTRRPRRLRTSPAMRELVAETTLRPADLILPMFIADGIDTPREITSMPGVHQHTLDSLKRAAHEALEAGVRCVDLFGVPRDEDKDADGTGSCDGDGVLNRALAAMREEFGDDVLLIVEDNGVGMTASQCESILRKDRTDSSGIGIKNVNDRLKIYFGDAYGVRIESEPDNGTRITVRFPQTRRRPQDEA